MTYLELCQAVAQESGTVPTTGQPTTVVDQTGRLLRIVDWVRDAWTQIQIENKAWRWMEADFSGTLVASTREYAPSALGISSRFRSWVYQGPRGEDAFTIYLASDGQDTEGKLVFRDWDHMRNNVLLGPMLSTTGKPQHVTIDPNNRLVFYPLPDDAYTVRGRYMKSAQTLASDSDEPEIPADFHEAIKWRALKLLALHDEDQFHYQTWDVEYRRAMNDLRGDQTPRFDLPMAWV